MPIAHGLTAKGAGWKAGTERSANEKGGPNQKGGEDEKGGNAVACRPFCFTQS
jgi:hypothetical protein